MIKYRTKTIQRLWHGIASLRDYEADQAIAAGDGYIIKCGSGKMTLSPEDLVSRRFNTGVRNKSKINAGQVYGFADYKWRPDEDNTQGSPAPEKKQPKDIQGGPQDSEPAQQTLF